MSDVLKYLQRITEKYCELNTLFFELGRASSMTAEPGGRVAQGNLNTLDGDCQEFPPTAVTSKKPRQNKPLAPFFIWLIAKKRKPTELGRVARLIAEDPDFPKDASLQDQKSYLAGNSARYTASAKTHFRKAAADHARAAARQSQS